LFHQKVQNVRAVKIAFLPQEFLGTSVVLLGIENEFLAIAPPPGKGARGGADIRFLIMAAAQSEKLQQFPPEVLVGVLARVAFAVEID
jgi:hypothetical protein